MTMSPRHVSPPVGADEESKTSTEPLTALADRIAAVLVHEIPNAENLSVSDLVRASSGLSRENWTFQATWRDPLGVRTRAMILRRDPAGSLLQTDRNLEFQVLRAVEGTGVPAPPVRWVDATGTVFGSPALIMDVVEGTCDWFALNGSGPLSQRVELARSFIATLGKIHRVDWQSITVAPFQKPCPNPATRELDYWLAELRRVQLEPLPEMEIALAWLRARIPTPSSTVLVHGDYKPGNALIKDGEITAILDWETAHPGDPLEDLGWVTNPARSREHQIRGIWERAQIIEAYTAATGYPVDPKHLLWWNVFSCWKLAVIVLAGLFGFVAGTIDRVYHLPTWFFQHMFTLMAEHADAP